MSPRVRDDAAQLIRSRLTDPESVCHALGLEVSRARCTGVMVLCPAHGERKPSCNVRQGEHGTLTVRCYACGFAGDVLALVAAVDGLMIATSYREVLLRAAELAGIDIVEDGTQRRREPARTIQPRAVVATPAPRPVDLDRLEPEAFTAAMRPLAHLGRLDGRGLAKAPTEYLARRGLLADAVADGWFAIGPHCGSIVFDAFGAELFGKLGMFDPAGELRHRSHVLAIPWRTPDGRTDTVQRRRVDSSPERKYVFPDKRGALHLYGIERLSEVSGDTPIVIVEGAIDVLARRRMDHSVVLGVAGVTWKPADGWDPIVSGRVVRIAFDADEAGDRAADKLAPLLQESGAVRVIRERVRGAKDWAGRVEKGCAA